MAIADHMATLCCKGLHDLAKHQTERHFVSVEAVQWAMDDAPMLRMPQSGEHDTTARAVLVARAERADADGRNSHAGIDDVVWRTGYTRNTVRDAEKRLEAGGLMVRDGKTSWGSTRWRLVMTALRDPAERDRMAAKAEEKRVAHAKRELDRRASRARLNDAREPLDGARARLNGERAPSVDPEPSLNHPGTTLEPPTGGAPPPDPRRAASPTAPRTDEELTYVDQGQPLEPDTQPQTARTHEADTAPLPTTTVASPAPDTCPHGRRLNPNRVPRCKACPNEPIAPTEPSSPGPTPPPEPSTPATGTCGTPGCIKGFIFIGDALPQRCAGTHPDVPSTVAPRQPRGPAPDDHIWIAVHRRGTTGHATNGTTTRCGRTTADRGHTLTAAAIAHHHPHWCDQCWTEPS